MLIKRRREGNPNIDQTICTDETIPNGHTLARILQEREESAQDERLADGEGQEEQSRDHNASKRPSERLEARPDQPILGRGVHYLSLSLWRGADLYAEDTYHFSMHARKHRVKQQ
jgi:hypothetical protein